MPAMWTTLGMGTIFDQGTECLRDDARSRCRELQLATTRKLSPFHEKDLASRSWECTSACDSGWFSDEN
eukprot:89885-Rhodomonas_salina.2